MYYSTDVAEVFVPFIVGMVVVSLLSIASSLLLAFCVYNDACYRMDKNPLLWAVLSGFFPIVALIYIIVKASSKNHNLSCVQCNALLPPGAPFCPRCGRPVDYPTPEQMATYNKRRKLLLGLWIAVTVLVVIITAICTAVFMSQILQFGLDHANSFEFDTFDNFR